MTAASKRKKALAGKVDRALAYPAIDAMKLIKETATAKFDESVDVAVTKAQTKAVPIPKS